MHRPCTNASSPIFGSRICSWMNCEPGSGATSRCCGFGSPSIPARALLPVLQLGPRTQHMAHLLIHSLRQRLAAFLPPPFHQRWLQPVLLCFDSSFWTLAPGESPRPESTPVASGGRADLWSGEEKLPATQTGASHAGDAPGDTGSSHKRLAEDGVLWTTHHRFH
jgi:hypothetical protein